VRGLAPLRGLGRTVGFSGRLHSSPWALARRRGPTAPHAVITWLLWEWRCR
jgi:hypothetical protein